MIVKFCICGGKMAARKFFFTVNIIDILICMLCLAGSAYTFLFTFNYILIAEMVVTFCYMCLIINVVCKTFLKKSRLYTKRNKMSFYIKLIAYIVSFYGKFSGIDSVFSFNFGFLIRIRFGVEENFF